MTSCMRYWRMPAKSAINYSSSLCKWLRSIHSDPRLIKKQCIRSCGQDYGFFLQCKVGEFNEVPNTTEFHVLPSVTGSAFGIPRESLDYLSNYGRIVSSSNGLLLLSDRAKSPSFTSDSCEFRVCNPATREWAPLPTPEGFKFLVNQNWSPLIECYPWRHDPLDDVEFPNDYTIALPVHSTMIHSTMWRHDPLDDGGTIVRQYSIEELNISITESVESKKRGLLIYSNGRWEEELCDISIEGRVLRYDMPVAFFSDTTKGLIVHYLCDSDVPGRYGPPEDRDDAVHLEPYIAAFDIREKKLLREIKLPEGALAPHRANWWGRAGTHRKMWISKWNDTGIILVRWYMYCPSIEAWVLDNYGCEGESWREVMSVSHMELWDDYDWNWTMSVGVASGRGLLIQTNPAFPNDPPHGKESLVSRVFLYVVEGEGKGRLELVGDHHFDFASVTFMPYANTLRPVSVQNAETHTY